MSDESNKRFITELHRLKMSGSNNITDELWYNSLCRYENYINILLKWLFLCEQGFYLNTPTQVLKKGTKLYRVRPFEVNTDFGQAKEWMANPNKTQNRANKQGEAVLYLSSTPDLCPLETFLNKGEKYALGEYVVSDNILTISFCDITHKHDAYDIIAIILNAFFIAPARNEKNVELFKFLDDFFSNINLYDMPPESFNQEEVFKDLIKIDLSLRFGAMNKKTQLYEITNIMSNALVNSSGRKADALRYSSCFIPIETAGIISNTYNIALFESGFNKVKFTNHEIKTYDGVTGNEMLQALVKKDDV